MPQPPNPDRRPRPPLTAKVLGVPAVAALLILLGAWWMGPSLFGPASAGSEARVVDATVTEPVGCSGSDTDEVVTFELAGRSQEGLLSGCGHDQDERVQITVLDDPAEAAGPVEVRLAATAPGMSDLRRPVGLALLLVGCVGGGTYAFLLARAPRLAAA